CGSYDKSLDYFEKIVKLNPDNEKALFYLGLTYLSKKWFKEGRDCMEKVIMKNPDNGEAHYYLGFIQKEYKMPEAIKTFEDALKTLKDEDYRNKCSLAAAVTSIEQNMIDMAVNLLNNAISKIDMDNPFRRDFLYNLGWAYFFKGDIEAALSNWDEVSSIDMNYENITEIVNSNVNSNFEEMERIYGIYASNITYPTAREYIGLKKEYDIDELDQHLGLWKQKMISLAKSRGVYIGPVKSAKVFSTLTKLKFKNMSHKIVTSLGYVIETEKIYKDGVDFETYKRSAKKTEKIYFRIRNWNDVVTEENVGMLAKDVKETGKKFATVILASCGKYTKKAKENAEKYNIRLYDSKLLDNILKKINDKE
ncbi:MAG: restriction endonuclease, partial [Candidatus Muiribacteriota bacterium]